MPSPKAHRRMIEEKSRRTKLISEKSASFSYGKDSVRMSSKLIQRPKTVPDIGSYRTVTGKISLGGRPRLTKLLLKVMIQGSLGPEQVVMSPESTVADVVAAALWKYAKEGRRPILHTVDPSCFDLHYSQFSLECLDREEKVMELGSRSFFLCPKASLNDGVSMGFATTSSCHSSWSKRVGKASKTAILNWLKFIDFKLT